MGRRRAAVTATLAGGAATVALVAWSTSIPMSSLVARPLVGVGAPPTTAPAADPAEPYGVSGAGRPLLVSHRSSAGPAGRRVLVVGSIHGDEPTGVEVVRRLEAAPLPAGADLWLVETANPDGFAAGTRGDGRGVDLNRNFPYRWANEGAGTRYWGGPAAASEAETRALMSLVRQVNPSYVIVLHTPLHAVDSSEPKSRELAAWLAGRLGLPLELLRCRSVCHGSFVSWVNARTASQAVAVEFGETSTAAEVSAAVDALLALSEG